MKAKMENWAYLLASNGVLLYGIIALGWPIFPLVLLWWWEGLLSTAVSIVIGKRAGRSEARWAQLLPYFVYFIFLIVFLGILAASEDQIIFNLMVVFFKNPIFNLCLLLLILHLGFRVFRGAPLLEEVFFYQIRIHVGILLGGLAIFISQQLGISNALPVALTVFTVKFLLDLWATAPRRS